MNVASNRRFRLLVLATHPIQYRAPLYRRLAAEDWLDVEVWYGDDYGVRPTASPWGVRDFRWDTDLLSGYRQRFFRNAAWRPGPTRRLGIYNPGLGGEVARTAPDAVWISGYASLHSWQSLLGAWRAKVPILYASDSNVFAEPGGVRGALKRVVVSWIYRRIAAFLVSGATNDAHYEAYGVPAGKRFPVPWAVDNERYAKAADNARASREEIRARWGVAEGRDVVLFSGRLSPEKDPLTLLRAVESDPRLHMVVAGSGPLDEEVNRGGAERLAGRFTALGFVNQGTLPSVYAAADLLVLPSRFEPWGLVVNEALAAGCPVVAADRVGAAHDLVPPAFRFGTGDPADLARAIEAWRGDRDVRSDPVRWARGQVRGFTFDADARGLRVACESIAAGTPVSAAF